MNCGWGMDDGQTDNRWTDNRQWPIIKAHKSTTCSGELKTKQVQNKTNITIVKFRTNGYSNSGKYKLTQKPSFYTTEGKY